MPVVIVVVCGLMLAGCGAAERQAPERQAPEVEHVFTIIHDPTGPADARRSARKMCADRHTRQVFQDQPPAVAADTMTKPFPAEFRAAAVEGCLAGLAGD